jgi:hypothetical protein
MHADTAGDLFKRQLTALNASIETQEVPPEAGPHGRRRNLARLQGGKGPLDLRSEIARAQLAE